MEIQTISCNQTKTNMCSYLVEEIRSMCHKKCESIKKQIRTHEKTNKVIYFLLFVDAFG